MPILKQNNFYKLPSYGIYASGPTVPISDALKGCTTPVDPTLISLPDNNDANLHDSMRIMVAKRCKATTKIAGH